MDLTPVPFHLSATCPCGVPVCMYNLSQFVLLFICLFVCL